MGLEYIDYRTLIAAAQGGDQEATNSLLGHLQNEAYKHLGRYSRSKISYIDYSDILQQYLIGCVEGIRTAKADVGDPMRYIVQRGKWAAVDSMRSGYSKDLRQWCSDCGKDTHINQRGGTPICPKCHGENVERDYIADGNGSESLAYIATEFEPIEDIVVANEYFRAFRDTLEGRKKDVFDLLINGYDRDNCQNYTKEIAARLGVNTANVGKRLRQIREAWRLFTEQSDEAA
ncbi:zinc ribbon domain-containing protein [Peribacillus simplex]|uniref:hypothetical protein n=1 Tax=Peribacillus simplex TaxID=1478 RepID=UPI002989AB14|nr:hypothetical protein [Peribacillus simplex]MBX9955097.1 zinc ribbon domain-containing protein [Peribacillus simplex]